MPMAILIFASSLTYGATQINTHQLSSFTLNTILQPNETNLSDSTFRTISTHTDNNRITHVRLQQTFHGYDVWGGEIILHLPHDGGSYRDLHNNQFNLPLNATSNGFYYSHLQYDLSNPLTRETSRQTVAANIIDTYLHTAKLQATASKIQIKTIVYILPATGKAVWAYYIEAQIHNQFAVLAEPCFIVDAYSNEIYHQWDKIEKENPQTVFVGGYGGNQTTGELNFDGTSYPTFSLTRLYSIDPLSKNFRGKCYLQNDALLITPSTVGTITAYSFPCTSVDPQHNNLYWNDAFLATNGGYSPPNDAMYGISLVNQFFESWYGLPIFTKDDGKTAAQIETLIFDQPFDYVIERDSSWDVQDKYLFLGRGGNGFYPLTSPEVIAHELAHAFTMQHSNLFYTYGSGAMNEAFSDMASEALEFYLTGNNDWRVEKEVIADPVAVGCKDEQDCAIRYMDNPPKDEKSYDDVVQAMIYNPDVHYGSGVFNKMFYLLSTSPHWNIQKAFNVMVAANENYWTKGTTSAADYKQIACGIVAAAKDFQTNDASYDVNSVILALKGVGYKDDGLPLKYPPFDNDLKDCE